MADQTMNIRITGESAQAEQAFRTIKRDLKSLGDSVTDLFNPVNMLKTALASLGAWVGIQGIRSIIEATLEMERLNTQFRVLTESTKRGAAEMGFVTSEANRLGQEITVLASAYSRLYQATKGTKFEGAPTKEMFSGFTEAFTALKMTSEQMGGVWLQINQGMMKGKIQLEDINIIGERGLNIIRLLEISTGKTSKELYDMIGKSKLSSDEYVKMGPMLSRMFGKDALAAAQELQGTFNAFANSWKTVKSSIGDGLKPELEAATKSLADLLPAVVTPLLKVWQSMRGIGESIYNLFNLQNGALKVLTQGILIIAKDLQIIMDGWGWIASVALPAVTKAISQIVELMSLLGKMAWDFANILTNALYGVGDSLGKIVKAGWLAVTGDFKAAGATLGEMFKGTAATNMQSWSAQLGRTAGAFKTTVQGMKGTWTDFLDSTVAWNNPAQKAKPGKADFGSHQGRPETAVTEATTTVTEFAKYREGMKARREANDTFWAYEEAGHKARAKSRIELVGWEVEQGIKTIEQGILEKETIQKAELDRSLKLVKGHIAQLQEEQRGLDRPSPDSRPDAPEQIAWNRAQAEMNQMLTKQVELEAQLAAIPQTTSIELERAAQKQIQEDLKGANDEWERQLSIKKELVALQAQNDAFGTSLTGTNAAGDFDSITDKTANQMAIQAQAHNARMKAIEDEKNAAAVALMAGKKTFSEYTEFIKKKDLEKSLYQRKNEKDITKTIQDDYKSRLTVASYYVGTAGQLFSALASTQDQSARSGFETAKAFNIGAAIMSTAAGIMSAFSAPDNVTMVQKVVAAAMVGLTGALNIAKIASTSFGGGGSASFATPSGSFGGGSGGSTGLGNLSTPLTNIQDSQTNESFDRLTGSTDNVAVQIGKLSKSMDDFKGMFEEGGTAWNLAINAPGIDTGLQGKTGLGTLGLVHQLGTAGLKAFFEPWRFGEMMKDMGRALFGGDWGATGAGMTLSVKNGMVEALNYVNMHKDGGLFSSGKNRTDYSGNTEATRYMNALIEPYLGDMTRMARTLGTRLNQGNYTATAANIATAGRKPEDIAKDLETWTLKQLQGFALTIDGLEDVVGAYDDAYAKLRLYNDALVSTNDALELIGKAQLQGSLRTGEWLSNMQQSLFGGMEEFSEAVDTYFTSMFDDEQQAAMKAAQASRQVRSAFDEMGIGVPGSKSGFVGLVNSLDITTESGAKTFAALMDISEAFATVQDHAKEASDAMDDLLKDSLTYSTDLLTKAMDTAAENLKAALSVAQNATSQLISLRGGNLTPQQNYHELKTSFTRAIAENDSATILRIGSQYAAASKAYNASGTNYQTDYQQIEQALAGLTGMQDTTDLSLAALNTHTTYLDTISKTISNQSGLMNINNGRLSDLNGLMAEYLGKQEELKRANQESYDSRVASAAPALALLRQSTSIGGLTSTIGNMVSGVWDNPFGLDSTMSNLASSVMSGTQNASTLQTALNSKIAAYFADYISKVGVTPIDTALSGLNSLPLAPTQNANDYMRDKAQSIMDAIRHVDPATGHLSYYADNANYAIYDDYIGQPNAAITRATLNDYIIWQGIRNGQILWDSIGLPAFANGGITSGPSLAGEGFYREAIIPLPDGRSVPVTINGSADNKETVAELKETNRQLAASVRVLQAGFNQMIESNERQEKRLAGVEAKARFAA